MAEEDGGSRRGRKLNVFISYSRSDLVFADEIAAGLEFEGGFEVTIDRDSIHEGEDWKARLSGLISAADTVVFVLTPASASSKLCAWEVSEAERLSKRILPVQASSLAGTQVPAQLSALNYVRFDPFEDGRPRSFVRSLAALCRALNTDLNWLREHTRLFTRAQEWDFASRNENRLLFGDAIGDAQAWSEKRPPNAPPVTELHRDYIAASQRANADRLSVERKRSEELERAVVEKTRAAMRARRALLSSLALLFTTGGAGAFAWRQMIIAESERAKSQELLMRVKASEAELLRQARGATEPGGKRPALAAVREEYTRLFATMKVIPQNESHVAWYVARLTDPDSRKRYQFVADATKTPWFVIGILHGMEAGFSFRVHLHNGDPLSARTEKVPAGRPVAGKPPFTWEESAVDAIRLDKFDNLEDWSLAATLYRFEAYNGFRARVEHGINTPYLWSFSNHYSRGKYVADNVWDANAVSRQCGAAVMLKRLVEEGLVRF